jgi:putative two-component system response regulator
MMNILVAEDDDLTAQMVAHALEKFGYRVTVARDGTEAFKLLRTGRYRLMVSDWQMPGMTGLELCEQIRRRRSSGYIYIILLTGYGGLDNLVCGMEAGADDFLTKPFNPAELLMRVRVGERVLALESRELTIFALAKLAESRDQETGEHLERMREYARILAEELERHPDFRSEIDGEYISLLYMTTPLHDIGKVAIPDRVLLKPGRLTQEEFEVMKTHTCLGAETLESVADSHPNASFLRMATEIALTHHERFDGKGYPEGLSGTDIPLSGRITSVADVYDALTSKRVYKDAYSHQTAREILIDGRETQFDARIVDAFLRRESDFLAIKMRHRDPAQADATDAAQQDNEDRTDAVNGTCTAATC